jgi:drug/metabolite transporter (DMT)-like permease
VERLVNGKIVALFGSFSSAIYFVVSRQMRSNNTPTFVTLNISLFGIFVFLILGYFFEGFMEGDENDTIFSLFLPK